MKTLQLGVVICLGIDPGPTPGTVGLLIEDRQITDVQLAQTSAGIVGLTIGGIVERWRLHPSITDARDAKVLIGVERFVVSRRSGRSSTAGAGATTRDMVGVVERYGEEMHATVVQRNASQVKAWATDERLTRAGIEIPSGMRHAKDAARHALFAACHAGYLPDPLSKTSKS